MKQWLAQQAQICYEQSLILKGRSEAYIAVLKQMEKLEEKPPVEKE